MNFGHGKPGFAAWPRAKSNPVAENCTVFSVSTPIAFDAVAITDLASCANATQTSAAAMAHAAQIFLNMSSSSLHSRDGYRHQCRAVTARDNVALIASLPCGHSVGRVLWTRRRSAGSERTRPTYQPQALSPTC